MVTKPQANELRRLASLWATARVRKAMTHNGYGGPSETPEGTTKRAEHAEKEFDAYLAALTQQESP